MGTIVLQFLPKMGIKIRIQFENSSSIFRAGEMVKGVLFLNSTEIKQLTLTFHGEGNVIKKDIKHGHFAQEAYNQRQGSHKNKIYPSPHERKEAASCGVTQTEVIKDPETGEVRKLVLEYKNQEIYLYASLNLPVTINENLKEQQIPFTFQLPSNLPCSCELKYGSVKYFAEACVDFKGSDLFKESFNILGNLDLALVSGALSPVMIEDGEQFFGFLCCCTEGDEFWMKLNLARSGFVPGENISFLISYKNETTITLKKITASLIQTIRYSAVGIKEIAEVNRLSEVPHNIKIIPGAKGACVGQLPVPSSTLLTDLGGCRIIRVRYAFRVTARGSAGRKAIVEIPITIGG